MAAAGKPTLDVVEKNHQVATEYGELARMFHRMKLTLLAKKAIGRAREENGVAVGWKRVELCPEDVPLKKTGW
jgi:hypothetical protein